MDSTKCCPFWNRKTEIDRILFCQQVFPGRKVRTLHAPPTPSPPTPPEVPSGPTAADNQSCGRRSTRVIVFTADTSKCIVQERGKRRQDEISDRRKYVAAAPASRDNKGDSHKTSTTIPREYLIYLEDLHDNALKTELLPKSQP